MDRTDTTATTARSRPVSTTVTTIALILLIIGGVNWALVGLFNFDLVAALLGNMSIVSRIVYVLVGLAGIYALTLLPRINNFSQPRSTGV